MPLKIPQVLQNKKIALVHDWLVSQRGGENVLGALCEIFPDAHLYTLIHKPGSVAPQIERMMPRGSFLNWIPGIEEKYRYFLPVMPLVVEQFDLRGYDVIISSSHCVAKGVHKSAHAVHVSYVHAPMRYMWDRFHEYFSKDRASLSTRILARAFRPYLRWWDQRSALGVDYFLANSKFIAGKIWDYYRREAEVVYPFCDLDRFRPGAVIDDKATSGLPAQQKPFLIVTALVPYKRVDLAIEAFNEMGLRLIVVGDGPDKERLQKLALPNIEFRGSVTGDSLLGLYSSSRALIFPGIEDFGIVPLEAMACGLPVIAFGEGGALETIVENETGLFFHEAKVASLKDAVKRFSQLDFDGEKCRKRALEFSKEKFHKEILKHIEKAVKGFKS